METLKRVRQEAYERVTKTTTDAEGVRASGTSDPHKMDRYVALTEVLEEKIAEALTVQKEITEAVYRVDDRRLRVLLMCRYVRWMTWEQIAEEMSYSRMQVWRLHGAALRAVEDVIACYP